MGPLFYLAIIAIQFLNSLASGGIPLKVLFHDGNYWNSFNTITTNPIDINHNGWILQTNDVKSLGMDNAILDDFVINFHTNVEQITFHTDLVVSFNYKTDGTLFSKPIKGEGLGEAQIKNFQMHMKMPFEIIEKDGNKYINLKDFDISYNIIDRAEFTFSNLYNGDKELSDTMHSLMNENWKDFTTEFGMFFFDEFVDSLFELFKNYGLNTPLENLSSC